MYPMEYYKLKQLYYLHKNAIVLTYFSSSRRETGQSYIPSRIILNTEIEI